jgi:hypothetical protein
MALSREIHMTTRLTILGVGLLWAASAVAGVPGLMNFQGVLKDGNGDPVTDGSYFATFRIYSVPAGGSPLWSDTQTVVSESGLFQATLGLGAPVPDTVFNDTPRYLGVTVFPDPELSPRQRLTTTPYAFSAVYSMRTDEVGANTTGYVPRWDGLALVSGTIYDDGANVGIGTNNPTAKLEVSGIVYSSQAGGGFRFPDGSLQVTAASSAIVYTRWGRTDCPGGSSLVYAGRMGGKNYSHSGSGSNPLCMSLTPSWDEFSDVNNNGALLYGAEYETAAYGIASFTGHQNWDVPCAVCLRDPAKVVLIQPGTQVCPAGWSLEYAGYLMSHHYTQNAADFLCLDRASVTAGSVADQNGLMLYPTEAECGSLPCPGYVQDREITCSVCSK